MITWIGTQEGFFFLSLPTHSTATPSLLASPVQLLSFSTLSNKIVSIMDEEFEDYPLDVVTFLI